MGKLLDKEKEIAIEKQLIIEKKVIEDMLLKIKKLRGYALTGDRDAMQGLELATMAAPFFREYGSKMEQILKQSIKEITND